MWFVDLVYGKHDGNACGRCVVDCLDGLRHDVVIGRYDDDTQVSDFGTTCTHSGKRFVSRSVEECEVASVGELDVVGSDVLCNATGLTGDYIGFAYVVEK